MDKLEEFQKWQKSVVENRGILDPWYAWSACWKLWNQYTVDLLGDIKTELNKEKKLDK